RWYCAACACAKARWGRGICCPLTQAQVTLSPTEENTGVTARGHQIEEEAMNFLHVLFGFSGRINRAKYWLALLFWIIVEIVVFAVLGGMLAKDILALGSEPSGADVVRVILSFGIGIILVILLVLLPMIVSGFAIGIKRLHDRDQSGWWILLFYFAPAVASGIGQNSDSGAVAAVLGLVSLGISIWAFVVLGCLRGTRGPNQYRPDPPGGTMAVAAA